MTVQMHPKRGKGEKLERGDAWVPWPLLALHLQQFRHSIRHGTHLFLAPRFPSSSSPGSKGQNPGPGGRAVSEPSGCGDQGPTYTLPSRPPNTLAGLGSMYVQTILRRHSPALGSSGSSSSSSTSRSTGGGGSGLRGRAMAGDAR